MQDSDANTDAIEEVSDADLIASVSRSSVSAFAQIIDRTSPAVQDLLTALPIDEGQRVELLAATYLEVWWLAGCHTESGLDVVEWIIDIARRRIADAPVSPGSSGETRDPGTARPGYASLELAALLRRPRSPRP
ncbi:hypothetical protein [Actinoplanes philippinensis]|uniref:hypothetical protein n=1 Tax=Actinoplanes philippinensis TaxID=35752 RepID=UPI0033E6A235